MVLQFQPPEWLIRDYMNRKSDGQQLSETLVAALKEIGDQRLKNKMLELKGADNSRENQELELKKKEAERKSYETFADTSNPAVLPEEMRTRAFGTVQGPQNIDQKPIQPAYDPNNPQDYTARYLQAFKAENPFGIKGREKETNDPSLQFMGTQGNNAVWGNPKNMEMYARPLPGNGPLAPKNAPVVPASQASEIGDFNSLLTQIGNVRSTYKPEFVGALDARIQNLEQKTGYGASTEAATFKASLAGIRNKLLNLLSGAAISPQEYQRLSEQLPDENSSDVDFLAKLNTFENNLKQTVSSRSGAFKAAGYSQPDLSVNPGKKDSLGIR